MAATAFPPAADRSGGLVAAQQTRGLLQEDAAAPRLAEKAVHLYHALGQELRDLTAAAAAFALAQLLQPCIRRQLMSGDATQQQQVQAAGLPPCIADDH